MYLCIHVKLILLLCVKVRFLADLVNAKVVASSSIMTLFDTFITVTYEPDIPHVRLSSYSCIIYEFVIKLGASQPSPLSQQADSTWHC